MPPCGRRRADMKDRLCGTVISSFLRMSRAMEALVTSCASVNSLRVFSDERFRLSIKICLACPSLRDKIFVSGAGMFALVASA